MARAKKAKICGVYCIRNKINGKVYIGSSKRIKERCWQHSSDLRLNKHYNHNLQNDYNIYGADAFEYGILEQTNNSDQTTLFAREQYYLDNTQNLYNICLKADGSEQSEVTKRLHSKLSKGRKNGMYGKHPSEETRVKLSIAHSGKNHWNYGKHWSEETRRKIAEANTGKHPDKEARLKMSNSRKGGLNARAIKVQCIETQKVYQTIKEASKDTTTRSGTISNCCKGKCKTAGGYHWKYYEE